MPALPAHWRLNKRWWPLLFALLLATPLLGWWAFGPQSMKLTLQHKQWRAEVEIEQLRQEASSDWCDELPADAFEVQPRQILDPTGQRAGEQAHCRYTVLRWRRQWLAQHIGRPEQAVQWPRPPLRRTAPSTGDPESGSRPGLGSERLGTRRLHWELVLRKADGKLWTCEVAQPLWQAAQPQETFRVPIDRWGTAHCADLLRARF